MTTYSYAGQVVHEGTRHGIGGLRVEAWDAARVCTELVSAAFTDASGSFTITVDDAVVQDLFLGRTATLYFKVFSEGRAIASTIGSLGWRVPSGNAGGRIEVPHLDNPISRDEPARFTVRGRVLGSRSGPVVGATVNAAHKTLRSEVALGSAVTDAAGRYQVQYSPGALAALGKQRADLVLHVHDAGGGSLADSPVMFQAPVTATIDVTVGASAYAGPAESDAILAVLARTAAGVDVGTLSTPDQAFLVSAEEIDPGALATLVAAAQLGAASGSGPSGAGLTANALAAYAAGRKGIPLTAAGILRVPPARIEAAAAAAIAANLIPVSSDTTAAVLASRVQQLAIAAALVPSADGLVATTGDVLGTVMSDAPTQALFLQLYTQRTSTSQFWTDLAGNASFSESGRVAALQLAFDVADTSLQHLPLIKAIVVGQVAGTVTKLRDLARLDTADWIALLNQPYGGSVIGAPASTPGVASYAASLASTLAARFPTPAIAGQLAKLNRPADADLIQFFTQNPDFELASSRVRSYIAQNPQATAGLSQPAAAVAALEARERVFKLTRAFEKSDLLIQAGVHSARAVETLGPTAFTAQFGEVLGLGAAQAVLNNACFVTAAVNTLHSRYSAKFNPILARGLPTLSLVKNPVFLGSGGGSPAPGQAAPVYLPPPMADWHTLFGTVDLCACDECASVYGPAAYLVDVLDFLANVPSTVSYTSGGQTLSYSARDLLIGPSSSTQGFSLVGRRPDIGHILLNCDNADTPVPYVDLLNEILEYKVCAVVSAAAGQPTVSFADGATTTGEAADLAANRQVLAGELPAYAFAYATLATASYPWSLPFDRAAQEAMAHLSMLGVPAPTLMQTFTPADVPASEAAAELAAQTLGLLPRDRAIIVGTPMPFPGGPTTPAGDWGLTSATNWQTQLLTVGTFLDATGLAYADLLELLDATLFTPFLVAGAPGPSIGVITPPPSGSDCDPMNLTINGLDPAKLIQLWPLVHRFLRLRAKLGVTTTELDKAIAQFGNVVTTIDPSSSTFTCSSTLAAGASLTLSSTGGLPSPLEAATTYYVVTSTAATFQLAATSGGAPIALTGAGSGTLTFALASGAPVPRLDDTTLERLAVIMTLRAQLRTSIVEMLSWWGPLDRRLSPLSNQVSLFSQTFLSPALSNAVDGDQLVFAELADPTLASGATPAGAPGALLTTDAPRAARVAAGSQLSGGDFVLLTDSATSLAVLGLPGELDGALLTVDSLSHVFRIASLARALKLSVGDLLQLRAFAGIDPFDAADLTQVTAFVETARQVQGSKFSVPDLAYLLCQLAPPTNAWSLVPSQAKTFLAGLAPLLAKIVTDTTFVIPAGQTGDPMMNDPTGAVTMKALGTILKPAQAAAALHALQAEPPVAMDVESAFAFLGTTTALAADIVGTTVDRRYGFVAPQLLLYLRRTQSIALIEGKLATALKLDRSLTSSLLETWLLSSRRPTTLAAIEDFLPAATPDGSGGPDLSDAAVASYIRLQKAALLVSKLNVGAGELPVTLPAPVGRGLIDLNTLPTTPGTVTSASTVLFASWQRLANTFAVRARLRGGPTALFDLLAEATAATPPTLDDFLSSLSQATGWPAVDVTAVVAFYELSLADFQKETGYITLANAFDVLTRLGASAASAIAWARSFFAAIDPALGNYSGDAYAAQTATDIKKAAKGKLDAAGWLAAAKPVSDQLRDAQRAALVAYLIGNTTYVPSPGAAPVQRYLTDNDLYDELLVDVDTSPSVMTSRLKLAMGSTQLFVQRCLLGLEQVTLGAVDAENWSWMKRYRVWEANRQIFLYPENWIVPELRDDKTELFQALETALAKQAVTADTVADAFNTYLEGYLELSNIDIVATYYETGGDEYGDDIVHVVGRTRGTPQDYYYRQRIGLQHWTGWEKITASIDGTVLLPVVFERRFFLFWPIVKVANDPVPAGGAVPTPGDAVPATPQHVEIQIAWIERKHTQWTGKKLADGNIVTELSDWNQYNLGDAVDFFDPRRFLLFDTQANEDAGTITLHVSAADPATARYVQVGEVDWNVCGETATCTSGQAAANWDYVSPTLPDGTSLVDNQPSYNTGPGLAIDESTAEAFTGGQPDTTNPVLLQTVTPYSLVFSRQINQFGSAYPFFLKDGTATFFVEEKDVSVLQNLPPAGPLFDRPTVAYRFLPHSQPYVCTFINKLNRYGFTGSQRWSTQVVGLQQQSELLFEGQSPPYVPWNSVAKPYPVADVDFSFGGAYSVYNWETFFHVPLLVATRLSQNQQFEDAHGWFLTIFDPTAPVDPTAPNGTAAPGRYWKVRPFWENTDLSSLAQQIASEPTLPNATLVNALLNQEDEPSTWDFQSQVEAWRRDPFNPHLIARTRPIAYQKMVVMRFLDNLIAWGDSLFRQDTIESINEATQLYILAAEVLGPRPKQIDHGPSGGPLSSAVVFRAASQQYGTASSASAWSSARTVELWAKPLSDVGADAGMWSDGNGSYVGLTAGNHWLVAFADASGTSHRLAASGATSVATGSWQHFVCTLSVNTSNDVTVACYTNGTLAFTATVPSVGLSSSRGATTYLAAGGAGTSLFDGEIAQVSVYGSALSAADVLQRYQGTPLPSALVSQYLFSEGAGVTLRDSLGGPSFTLVNAPAWDTTATPPAATYWNLAQAGLDAFGDAVINMEGLIPTPPQSPIACPYGPSTPDIKGDLYFCVPANPQLLAYWDTVADRLFKIRHSMNIQGIVQQLPLFEPPIDPALLVAARAAGVDIDQVIDSVNGPQPIYRFAALMPKALEVAAGVSQLGASLLSTLEKSDAEGLATLRSGQEVALLQLVRDVKQRQVDEAQANIDALSQTLAQAQARQSYYHSRVLVSPGEGAALGMSALATVLQVTSQAIVAAGGAAQLAPTGYGGTVGPLPTALVAEGGENIGSGVKTAGEALGIAATILHEGASVASTMAGYQRRMDDWQFQAGLADIEVQQVNKQIIAAQIRLDIATKELADHDQQIENAQSIDDYLHGKFTNQDLYDWMSSQIAATYFQSYQRAFDVAKRAERAYQLELALPVASFVEPGNWDNLRQGLLAGEKLQYDLRRMELSYMDENVRELEIAKHVSLAQSFPQALFTLLTTGSTTVQLPEGLFDLDYPGHYLRRLKTVSLTLPNVSGPYTSVNCTLTQTSNVIRKDTVTSPSYQQAGTGTPPTPPTVPQNSQLVVVSPTAQIVTSGGVNDAGLFELNFHDERYLPFEGTGAIGSFQIDLPPKSNPFDIGRLEDVVLHLKYTARYGGNTFRDNAVKPSLPNPPVGTWLIRVAADRATAWFQFMNPAAGASPTLTLDLSQDQFPFLPGGGDVAITQVQVAAQAQGSAPPLPSLSVTPPGGSVTTFTPGSSWTSLTATGPLPQTWTFTASADVSSLSELWILVHYTMGA